MSEEEEEPKDLRSYIDQISRLSFNEDDRPDSVLSFRPGTAGGSDLTARPSEDVPQLELSGGSDLSPEEELPDSGLGPSGGDDNHANDRQSSFDSETPETSAFPPSGKSKRPKAKSKKAKKQPESVIDVLPPVRLHKKPPVPVVLDPSAKPETSVSRILRQSSTEEVPKYPVTKSIDPLILQAKVEKCMNFADEEVVTDWLVRANQKATCLRQWCAVPSQFVAFSQFWLVDFIESQRSELFDMEHEILIEELSVGFSQGLDTGSITKQDLAIVLLVAFNEYPDKFFGTHGNKFFIDTLMLLLSGRSNNYKKFLSSVRYKSSDKAHLQIILSIRVFAVFNYFNAILEFFCSYHKMSLGIEYSAKSKNPSQIEKFVQDALEVCLENDYLATLSYFVKVHKINPNARDSKERSLLFRAVMTQAKDCVSWLTKNVTIQTVNYASDSGNTALHAAVNIGNPEVIGVLLSVRSIDLECKNGEMGGMTPLSLAVFQGNLQACQLLMQSGADPNQKVGDIPIAEFASDMGFIDISELLQKR